MISLQKNGKFSVKVYQSKKRKVCTITAVSKESSYDDSEGRREGGKLSPEGGEKKRREKEKTGHTPKPEDTSMFRITFDVNPEIFSDV